MVVLQMCFSADSPELLSMFALHEKKRSKLVEWSRLHSREKEISKGSDIVRL